MDLSVDLYSNLAEFVANGPLKLSGLPKINLHLQTPESAPDADLNASTAAFRRQRTYSFGGIISGCTIQLCN
jgi:hypothetical protein